MDTIPNRHDTDEHDPDGNHPEWTPSRMGTIPNGHNPEWTQSKMDSILNTHFFGEILIEREICIEFACVTSKMQSQKPD